MNPEIIALCETKKADGIKEDEMRDYSISEKNEKPGKEGLLVAVKKGNHKSMDEITDTELKNVMTVRIEFEKLYVRVIVGHAPQETEKAEIREEFFEELSIQIERGLDSGDVLIVVGDFNANISIDAGGNISPGSGSPNGKKVCELLEKYQLKVGNFHSNTTGKWTRIQKKKDKVCKSMLDFLLLSPETYHLLEKMEIDEDKIYCPYREGTKCGRKEIVFSDHCVMGGDYCRHQVRNRGMREELGLLDAMPLTGGSGLVRDWGHENRVYRTMS